MEWTDISSVDAQFQLLVDLASEVVFRVDDQARFEWVSPNTYRLTGWLPDDLVGRSSLDVVPPDGLVDLVDVEARLRRGERVDYRGRFRHADGTERWTLVTVIPVLDEEGELLGTVGVAHDVHDEVVALEALADSEAHYRLLADHVTDIVLRLNPDLTIDWVSPSVRQLGWDPDALVGQPVRPFVHPDDWQTVVGTSSRLGAPPRPDPAKPCLYVLRVLAADGTYRFMRSKPQSVYDAAGNEVAIVSNWSDVGDLVEAWDRARQGQAQLRATIDSLLDPHVLLEPVMEQGEVIDFECVEANPAALRYTRLRADELIGARMSGIRAAGTHSTFLTRMKHVLVTGEPLVLDDQEMPPIDGRIPRCDLRAVRAGDVVSVVWRDVTDRHDFEERLSSMALHDTLTGLANRPALHDELHRALVAARRSGAVTAVLMMDLDHFKFVNDTHGHPVGDQLLVIAADRLRRVVREGDLVARLGGDEFVVVMRDIGEPEEAFHVAARMIEEFRQPIRVGDHEMLTTASLGIAIADAGTSDTSATVDELLREADIAMYRAKENGRNRSAAYNEALRVAAGERLMLEQQLRPALGLGELVVFFQPEVDLRHGDVVGAEALLRWHHRSGELYAADRFIELAEQTGLIVDIGRWVLREACRTAAGWALEHPGRLRTVYLNLARAQLGDALLADDLAHIVEETGVDPGLLCVEISETALSHATSVVDLNLARIRALGIRLAIDDFGRGDAALTHLRHHRVDVVKIDRSFVRDVEHDDYASRLVAGITALAAQVGLTVVAEGVETASQARVLRDLGCATAHGFFFSGAVPADDFPRLLAHTHSLD